MPTNLIKKYPDLLELIHLTHSERLTSLNRIFQRDIAEPIKKEDGEPAMETLFHHLTTRIEDTEEGRREKRRLFEMDRSQRLHWILHHLEEKTPENIIVFSHEDRVRRRDVIRTYIYDKVYGYVIILEPQRSGRDYYLLTAYYLNEKRGKKQIKQKLKNKLPAIY